MKNRLVFSADQKITPAARIEGSTSQHSLLLEILLAFDIIKLIFDQNGADLLSPVFTAQNNSGSARVKTNSNCVYATLF